MGPNRLCFIDKLLLYSGILCVGTTAAQTPDQIRTFDSQIKIHKHLKPGYQMSGNPGGLNGSTQH
jgi:hypothetical protein